MRNILLTILTFLFLVACKEAEPRRPVQVKSGSFFKESVERSKKLLEIEEQLIQEIIQKDSSNTYISSSSGFWYHYEGARDTTAYLPKTNDIVLLAYNMMSFAGDTIYTAEDIGLVEHAVGKSQLFPGLRNAVKLLGKGEKATFLFPSSQVYGYKGDSNKIGPNVPIKSSLTLLEIQKDSSNIN